MKYRPVIKSIDDLQEGDEFLVGESRWGWRMFSDSFVARALILAKVPIERDIPCPEGYELKQGDGEWVVPSGAKWWGSEHVWRDMALFGGVCMSTYVYAIPKQPQVFEGEVISFDRPCLGSISGIVKIPVNLTVGTKVRVEVVK